MSIENRIRNADTLRHRRQSEQAIHSEINRKTSRKTESHAQKDVGPAPARHDDQPAQSINLTEEGNSKKVLPIRTNGILSSKPECASASDAVNNASASVLCVVTEQHQSGRAGSKHSEKAKDEKIAIKDIENKNFKLNQNYYDVKNTTEDSGFIDAGRKLINSFYENYGSTYPILKSLASSLLKEKIKEKFHLELDPDKFFFLQFNNVMYEGGNKIHYAPVVKNGTLTEWLFTNFDAQTQDNLQDIDALCGIYNISQAKNKEYHSSDAIKIKPTDFIKLVWDIDFYNYAKNSIEKNYQNKNTHIKKYFLDIISHLHNSKISKFTARDVLTGIGMLQNNDVDAFIFDINGYRSSNAFSFKNSNGRVTIYFPYSEFKFKSFGSDSEMRSWIADSCSKNHFKKMISSHFSIYNRQDGIFYYGIDSWLNSINDDNDYKQKILINHEKVDQKNFFDFLFYKMKEKGLSDLDSLIKSDAEIRRDMWEEMIDASNIFPNPISPFLSLGIHIEHATEADTFDEKMRELNNIKYDILNIITMILLDNLIKFPDIEGYELINKIKINKYLTEFKRKTYFENFRQVEGRKSMRPPYKAGKNLPTIANPPRWYNKNNILNDELTAEGVIFKDPEHPDRLIKFYKKENRINLARKNSESFKRIYNDTKVEILKLNSINGKKFFSVNMPKIKGISLSDIRKNNFKKIGMIIAKEIKKNDIILKLVSNLQDLNINAKDLNIGNTLFDVESNKFNLIDFDYSETSFPVTDHHFKSMYQSLHTKIKQDFLVPLMSQFSDKPNELNIIRSALKKMDRRFTILIMNNRKPRLSGFRAAIEKYNSRWKGRPSQRSRSFQYNRRLSDPRRKRTKRTAPFLYAHDVSRAAAAGAGRPPLSSRHPAGDREVAAGYSDNFSH